MAAMRSSAAHVSIALSNSTHQLFYLYFIEAALVVIIRIMKRKQKKTQKQYIHIHTEIHFGIFDAAKWQ